MLTQFLAFKETFESAKAAGLSVGNYIDSKQFSGVRSPTDQTIDGMAALGVFDGRPQRICEIGPGSCRYSERTIAKCQPLLLLAAEWRNWLVAKHGVIGSAMAECWRRPNLLLLLWSSRISFFPRYLSSTQSPTFRKWRAQFKTPGLRRCARNCELVGQPSEQMLQNDTARLARAVTFCFTAFSVRRFFLSMSNFHWRLRFTFLASLPTS